MRYSGLILLQVLVGTISGHTTGRREFKLYESTEASYHSSQSEVQSISRNRRRAAPVETPLDAAEGHLNHIASGTTFRVSDQYTDKDTGVAHVYFVQTHNDLDIENARANVNVKKDRTVFSSGSSFVLGDIKAPPLVRRAQLLSPTVALRGVISTLDLPINADKAKEGPKRDSDEVTILNVEGTVSPPKAELAYFNKDGELKIIWKLETDIGDNWLLIYADAMTEKLVHAVVDYGADAGYNVYPFGINDPDDGERVLITDPANLQTSPLGYHTVGDTVYRTTRGNNAIAQENWSGGEKYLDNLRPHAIDLDFDYAYGTEIAEYQSYVNASITQLFYTTNMYHDLLETLGFTEAAGNFEEVNTGEGGKGGDAVQLNTQDGSGMNNANFLSPPDGSRPRMRMYMWNKTSTIQRDSSFDASVVIHEYTHGLSNRLTGGPSQASCLGTAEARAMGEGWGDFFASAIAVKPGSTRKTDYAMGSWVNGSTIRKFPYSTDMSRNPILYTTLNDPVWQAGAPHAPGTVWATMLYELLWNLIDKHGYSENRFPEFEPGMVLPTKGPQITMKLVLEGMKLQPCQPSFITARDAIVDADLMITEGENYCEIWKAFAKRGLGTNAKQGSGSSNRETGYELPEGC